MVCQKKMPLTIIFHRQNIISISKAVSQEEGTKGCLVLEKNLTYTAEAHRIGYFALSSFCQQLYYALHLLLFLLLILFG